MALLEVQDLHVSFKTIDGVVRAVEGVSLSLEPRKTLGVVGESGSGKSVTAQTVIGLTRFPNATITGKILFDGRDLVAMPTDQLRSIRGARIAMIFQDPLSSLHPFFKVGHQIVEAIRTHEDVPRDVARRRAVEALRSVGIPSPEERFDSFPHEMSGGMRQRAMIAMSIANSPSLLIADEPTTALDVTIQAQVLEVLKTVQDETKAATILITHDLGIVAELCERVLVMYAGRIVEAGDVYSIFRAPRHPYTIGLLDSLPKLTEDEEWLRPITGAPPSLINLPSGCAFHPRCFLSQGRAQCRENVPVLNPAGEPEHLAACHYSEELVGYESKFSATVSA